MKSDSFTLANRIAKHLVKKTGGVASLTEPSGTHADRTSFELRVPGGEHYTVTVESRP